MMRHLVSAVVFAGLLAGCRGTPSAEPPVHLNPNMDTQDKYKAYRESSFFADGRAMRDPAEGTVPRGFERASDHYWRGQNERGDWVERLPSCTGDDTTDCVDVNIALLERGQGRFNIFCAPCHDDAGYGKGAVALREAGLPPVPSYHDATRPHLPLGQIFHIISHGERGPGSPLTMAGYAAQIPVADRWAIAAYVRALQRSQNAKPGDEGGR